MTVRIALLRAINVGGRGKLAMADLRGVFTAAGFTDVQTVLQTGNVIFRSEEPDDRALEARLEEAVAAQLGLQTDIMIRDADGWRAMIAGNPFPGEAKDAPGHLVGMFLKASVTPAAVKEMESQIKGRERVQPGGQQLFIFYADGIGRSKLTNAWIEARLGTRGTGRNWNTILKIGAAVRTLG